MMEYRNPTQNENGTFDCEINHPEFGWIPFTATPDDPDELGRNLYSVITSYIGEHHG